MPRKAEVRRVDLDVESDALLNQWFAAQQQLEQVKANENALRMRVTAKLGDPNKLSGTENIDINGSGYILKIEKTINYTMTNEDNATSLFLDGLAAINPALCIGWGKWTPELSVSHYKEVILPIINDERHVNVKALAAAAIKMKPGMAQVSLIPPKTAGE